MEVVDIGEDSPYLSSVLELSKANSSALGFLPVGAFRHHASRKQLLIARDHDDTVVGYLLYATAVIKQAASIVHLCVVQDRRRGGVAKALFLELVRRTKDVFRGIRVHCRRDYDASGLWPKLGFEAIGEIPGRSARGSTLTVWWYDHGHPSLLTYADKKRVEAKLPVVIDANVFYQLEESPSPTNEESRALLTDWLADTVELCITPELMNEINRHPDSAERRKKRRFADSFVKLSAPDEAIRDVAIRLAPLFAAPQSASDASDLRHLERAIAADSLFFVTRDDFLLRKGDALYAEFGIRVARPADLILFQDSLRREQEYRLARLAGSLLRIQKVQSGHLKAIESQFRSSAETRATFSSILLHYFADPVRFQSEIVLRGDVPLALVVYDRSDESICKVPILRFTQDPIAPTLARQVLRRFLTMARDDNRLATIVTDPSVDDELVSALGEVGFVSDEARWVRLNVVGAATAEALSEKLAALSSDCAEIAPTARRVAELVKRGGQEKDMYVLREAERALWPHKILDLDVPTFVVPIRPEWALNLFDEGIAAQDLLGADPTLMFRLENVYYRSARPRVLTAPARVLWYVSKGSGRYQETMAIRACSMIDEVVIGTAKSILSRHRRLGVYHWKDVKAIAGRDPNEQIMAFRFSDTETFRRPIPRTMLETLWRDDTGKAWHLRGPLQISRVLFAKIYSLGTLTPGAN